MSLQITDEWLSRRKSPQNSSLPPSTQHPHARPPLAQPKSQRPRGGQSGHAQQERGLIPTDQCTAVVPLKPTACRRCGTTLTGCDDEPLRHQVWELPEIQPLVTEYQRHRLTCRCCGAATCAALPSVKLRRYYPGCERLRSSLRRMRSISSCRRWGHGRK